MKKLPATLFSCKATALLFAVISLVSAAQAQTLYVTTNGGGLIEKVSATGVVSGFATGLLAPKGLAFGPDGNLYVSQDLSGSYQSLVSKVTSDGVVHSFASGLLEPIGLAFNTSGDLFIADYTQYTIFKVTSGSTTPVSFATSLNSPFGLAFNSSGSLFVANRDNNTVVQLNSSGSVIATLTGFSQPNDLVFDGSGNLFVSNFSTGTISKVAFGGNTATIFVSGINSPVGLAFNPITGALFVASQGTGWVDQVAIGGGSFTNFAYFSGDSPQYLAFAPSSVPEPSTYAMFAGLGVLGFAAWRRRKSVSA